MEQLVHEIVYDIKPAFFIFSMCFDIFISYIIKQLHKHLLER